MFIETEQTPNPATLEIPARPHVMVAGTADFATPDEAARSPLANGCFKSTGVPAFSSARISFRSPRRPIRSGSC